MKGKNKRACEAGEVRGNSSYHYFYSFGSPNDSEAAKLSEAFFITASGDSSSASFCRFALHAYRSIANTTAAHEDADATRTMVCRSLDDGGGVGSTVDG